MTTPFDASVLVPGDVITDPWALWLAVAPFTRRALLHSETPGTGKTTAGIMLAKERSGNCTVITATDAMQATDLLGHYLPKGREFTWHDGPGSQAIRRASHGSQEVVVVNELDHAGPDVQHAFYALLEDGDAATFTLPSTEVLTIPDTLTIIATMNPDPRTVLTPAVLNRFQVVIDLGDNVSPMILAALPESLSSMVADKRIASREAFSMLDLIGRGCPMLVAVQAVLGIERTRDYGDALAIALS